MESGVETQPRSGDVAAEIVHDVQRLVDLEVRLARQELKELAFTNVVAAACIATAGLLALVALLVALPVLVVEAVPWHWQAALIWMIANLVLAGGLYLFGRSRVRLRPPTRTLDSLKENKEWALRQLRLTGR
ncbi:MAG TPA: phage holin family protein [Candidatus Dormibacteraeota bacterium]|nr:phage holin family protein [Candidatus Dormibacteraeota bacterium]